MAFRLASGRERKDTFPLIPPPLRTYRDDLL